MACRNVSPGNGGRNSQKDRVFWDTEQVIPKKLLYRRPLDPHHIS